MQDKKNKVIVINDSLLFGEILAIYMNQNDWVDVVATANTKENSMVKIKNKNPEVIIIDLDNQKINSIDFIKEISKNNKYKIVVISSSINKAYEAIDIGADDYIEKPIIKGPEDLRRFSQVVCKKIYSVVTEDKKLSSNKSKSIKKPIKTTQEKTNLIVALGASTGGVDALVSIVTTFPADMPPVLITQHMPEKFTEMFAKRLNGLSKLEVKEAKDGDRLKQGQAIIAAGNYHMKLKKDLNGYYISSKKGEKVSGHCPSIDVLFNSVAQTAKANAIGVILTGMGEDGAHGLLEMKKQGAFTIGQDKDSCVVYGMPKVAYEIGAVDIQKPLHEIPREIMKHIKR